MYHGPMRTSVQEIPEPDVGPDDLLLAVEAVGICGSDVHGFAGTTGRRRPGMVMGHEVAARVIGWGERVTGWTAGETVAINPVIGCNRCERCAAGATNTCATKRVIGVDAPYTGAYAERMTAPARNAVRSRGGVWQAALVEPLAVGLQAVRQAGIGSTTTVAVLGAGMIGLATTWAAVREGAPRVYVGDLDGAKAVRAGKLGAVGLPLGERTMIEALAESGGPVVHRSIDAIGISATLRACIQLVEPGGTVCIVGMGSPDVELPAYAITTAERNVVGSFCYREAVFREVVAALLNGEIDVDVFVDREIGLDEAPEAFRELATGERASVKTVVRPEG